MDGARDARESDARHFIGQRNRDDLERTSRQEL
jgi:hypothetical protein